ncbi:Mitochondrial import inner membrane translocase subunit tim44 [Cyphellophora attinorum]|uniref:Mitochondrial import inner membrane translocase subunit TIM44 n=1 Tax=Cyphellophora attinorum TaxID=1664694 RepID=A0A0N1HFT2_9EURO|nr:Mitochondrial import inner membrane translocase subunit tim44 [Phialophora attinorum]KPI44190.1 Mitochondrial import inner membrane translocase subunit tim44 [Phialophora attinorum]
MLAARRAPAHSVSRYVTSTFASASTHSGRTAAYRRLNTLSTLPKPHRENAPLLQRSNIFSSQHAPPSVAALIRPFHYSGLRPQEPKPKDGIRDSPRPAEPAEPSEQKASEEPKSEEGKEGEKKEGEDGKEQKKEEAPPPPHGDKTPWQVFTETLRTEFKASQEWQDSTKQLAGEVKAFNESDSVRKAREASSAVTGGARKVVRGTGEVVGKGVSFAWNTSAVQGVRAGVNATGRGLEKASRPIRETQAFKDLSDALDDGSSARYGGWTEREERKRLREQREQERLTRGGKPIEPMVENPDAGTNVTVHKDSAWKESWNEFKSNSKVMQGLFNMRNTYEESENPLISTARSIGDRVAGFFAENETAKVIKKFREIDPNFQLEPFLREMREYMLPEVLDAYVKGDVETLKLWLSAAQFQVWQALMDQYTKAGLKSDGKILDIRHVDIMNARILEPGDIPVFIITCRTQEVHVYRKKKTNELAAVNNPETRGWRFIELQKAARDYI